MLMREMTVTPEPATVSGRIMVGDHGTALTAPARAARLRIAVVTETWPPEVNGVAGTAARFVQGLSELGHDVQVVRPRQPVDVGGGAPTRHGELLVRGLSIPRYPQLKMGMPSGGALRRAWHAWRPDLVHLVTEGPLGLSALMVARTMGLPLASDFRTNFHAYSRHYGIGWAEGAIAGYLRAFHNRTQATMVPTAAMRDTLGTLGFANLHVIARGVDTVRFDPARRSDELRRSWGAGPLTPVVMHVGRIAAEKNLDTLVSAVEAIRRTRPDARTVFVGDGPQAAALKARCPYAVFAGMRSGTELAEHYASGDLFLFPSLTETYGNVTLEAMASGLAVVAFDQAAAGEHLRNGRDGLLAPSDRPELFVRHAVALADDFGRRRAFGESARQVALSLSWDRVVLAQQAVFYSVLHRARDGGRMHASVADALQP